MAQASILPNPPNEGNLLPESVRKKDTRGSRDACSMRFEAAKTDGLFGALDAVAWLKAPTVSEIAQFAGIDPRTAGKLVKNCVTIGLLGMSGAGQYALLLPYPHKGTLSEKQSVIRESLIRMPLLESVRQFIQLGDTPEVAMRKGASVQRIANYEPAALSPLLDWARQFDALTPGVGVEDLLEQAVEEKEKRHQTNASAKVVFLSHSSADKPFIRRLATDLTTNGVKVWLDEQNIRVGDSIPESIAQGVAESDFFVIAISEHSVKSEWVKRELNSALVREIAKRKTAVLPVKLGDVEIPDAISDKRYADFSTSYKQGLHDLLAAINREPEPKATDG